MRIFFAVLFTCLLSLSAFSAGAGDMIVGELHAHDHACPDCDMAHDAAHMDHGAGCSFMPGCLLTTLPARVAPIDIGARVVPAWFELGLGKAVSAPPDLTPPPPRV